MKLQPQQSWPLSIHPIIQRHLLKIENFVILVVASRESYVALADWK